MASLRVACLQMDSGPDMAFNLGVASRLVRDAAAAGAHFIATPEATDQILPPMTDRLESAYEEQNHPAITFFTDLAAEVKIWLLVGSLCVKGQGRCFNRSFLFSPRGLEGRYDKIHLYEADLPTGEKHRESRVFAPGTQAVVAQTPWGGLGMSVCYDLRFGHLYRDMAKAGAVMMAVPAAFTVPTGRAHWKVLLRARAVEAGAFVLAPAQGGTHGGARRTYGHTMIVSPWGKVLAERTEPGPGSILADIDLAEVQAVRAAIPTLRHDRFYNKA